MPHPHGKSTLIFFFLTKMRMQCPSLDRPSYKYTNNKIHFKKNLENRNNDTKLRTKHQIIHNYIADPSSKVVST